MTAIVGNDGVIKVGNVTVAELTGYTVDVKAATIETTAMGNDVKTFVKGIMEWSGSADVHYDKYHWANITTFNATSGAVGDGTVTFNLYPTGTGGSNKVLNGNAIVTGYSVKGTHDGLVTATVSFQGSGALTETN